MNKNDDKQLWDLLSKAGNTSPSPMFTQNILQTIQDQNIQMDIPAKSRFSLFSSKTILRAAACAVALFTAVICFSQYKGVSGDYNDSFASSNYSEELTSVETAVLILQREDSDPLIEAATSCKDDLSEEEMLYLLANI